MLPRATAEQAAGGASLVTMLPGRSPIAPLLLVLALAALAAIGAVGAVGAGGPDSAGGSGAADPRVAWLREHAIELATIDPASPTTADLEPLKTTLAGVRVVVLGEATRGDGSTFLAKARLIRFLHERMGFDLLVLDCGFYRCGRAWNAVRAAGDSGAAREALLDALSPMRLYTESAQFQPLLDLVVEQRDADHPLVVAGAGPELGGDGATMIAELGGVLRRLGVDPAGVPGFDAAARIVAGLGSGAFTAGQTPMPPPSDRARFDETLDAIRRRLTPLPDPGHRTDPTEGAEEAPALGPRPSAEELAFWRQVLVNLETEAHMTWKLGVYRPGDGVPPEITSLVNRQTADNLLWLAEHGDPGHKMVVSARTVFVARHLDRLETGDLEVKARLARFTTVGDLLEEALGDRAYLVGFTAFDGRAGTPFQAPYDLLVPTAGSFEELMARTGIDAAFVDLRGLRSLRQRGRRARWLTRPLIARPLSFLELRGSWPRHLDAFVFLRTMAPSRRSEPATPPRTPP